MPEVPAESCAEIKAVQGEQAVSGDYWLDPQNTGEAFQIFFFEDEKLLVFTLDFICQER